MGTKYVWYWLLAALAALSSAQTPLTNESIIKMVKAGLGENVVITAIQGQPAKYSTEADDLIALKTAGVSDKIISAMMAKINGGAPSTTPAASNNNPAGLSDKGPEPEFQGTVYWLDRGNNKLNALERQKPRGRTKATPFVGAKSMTEIEGDRSPVRFAADSKPEFIFQAPQNVDPQGLAAIVKFNVKKGHREVIRARTHGFMGLGSVSSGDADTESVPFQALKYNESSIRITPTMPLPPGEYGIFGRGMEIFCFGVN